MATDDAGTSTVRRLVTVSSSEGTATTDVAAIGIGAPTNVDVFITGAADGSAASVDDVVVTGTRVGGLRTSPTSNFGLGACPQREKERCERGN